MSDIYDEIMEVLKTEIDFIKFAAQAYAPHPPAYFCTDEGISVSWGLRGSKFYAELDWTGNITISWVDEDGMPHRNISFPMRDRKKVSELFEKYYTPPTEETQS